MAAALSSSCVLALQGSSSTTHCANGRAGTVALSFTFLPKSRSVEYHHHHPALRMTSSGGKAQSSSSSCLTVRATIAQDKEVAGARGIEQESILEEKPELSCGRMIWEGCTSTASRTFGRSLKRRIQNEVCAAVEAIDGGTLREDAWSRPGGGGGVSRVLQNGTVWDKAGVNVSVVYGSMPPEAYRAATGTAGNANKAGCIPF